MKNIIKLQLSIILLSVTLIHANSINLLGEKFHAEQVNFAADDLHDED